jgi:hypothetical protein
MFVREPHTLSFIGGVMASCAQDILAVGQAACTYCIDGQWHAPVAGVRGVRLDAVCMLYVRTSCL